MLDFSRLRSGPEGWRGSFDALVRHLGSVNPPAAAQEFRHIEGAGGDGGIEAYWVLSNGDEVGYQAKFHTRSSDIDWAGLDRSIETALTTHPRLTAIQVAVACDLTDTVAGRRGNSGRDLWNRHRERWEQLAEAQSRTVEFSFWGASEIEQLLTQPAAAGLREYWFGDTVLSPAWLADQFERTAAMLDERFHPEDHVDVRGRLVFDGLLRTEKWSSDLAQRHQKLIDADCRPPVGSTPEIQQIFNRIAEAIAELRNVEDDITRSPQAVFPTSKWQVILGKLRTAQYEASEALEGLKAPADPSGTERSLASYERERLRRLGQAIDELDEALEGDDFLADRSRLVLMTGRAGSGKSHLIASEVQAAIGRSEPAVMLLGTDFDGVDPPGTRILRRLDDPAPTFAAFLGMLEAAAESAGSRALIAIDAINEGGGGRYWRERLPDLVATVRKYPRIALCISCRTEFVENVVRDSVRSAAVSVFIPGFVTAEEQEAAARVYMDRRGIVRPATPWLSPEFTNPLFLRTTCLSLQRDGKHEFPRGLRGTREMLRFYLESASRHLGTPYDGTNDLFGPLKDAVRGLADHMANNRIDYVANRSAAKIVDNAFGGYSAPGGKRWLDLLRENGIVRSDPGFTSDDDPLADVENVYRFGFQRFQDHLVAASLLAPLDGPKGHFDPGGHLAFMLGRFGVEYEWAGVFQALAIQFADNWKAEIVDEVSASDWFSDALEDAFVESVRWRLSSSFTPRTLQILNRLDGNIEMETLLLELALVQDHPWNAELLDRNLARLPMPRRDRLWTQFINRTDDDPGSPAIRIIDWSIGPGAASAPEATLTLALCALGWFFTSTNGRLRDRATKAAVEILLRHPNLHGDFFRRFANIDDLYVVERMLAATAGACLRDPSAARLSVCAELIWAGIFREGSPPIHLLARDYARLVMDLAAERNLLPEGCDISICRPPYGASAPRFGLKAEVVEAASEAVGGYSIFSSCAGMLGDFGRYVIKSRIRDVTSIRLSKPRPLTHEEAFQAFRDEFAARGSDESQIFELIETVSELVRSGASGFGGDWASSLAEYEAYFVSRLPAAGKRRYRADAKPYLNGAKGWKVPRGKLPRQDGEQATLWVARRALSFGWTSKLFPRDGSHGEDRIRATRTERIGKKYQWLAYYELLARLADNYWLAEEWIAGSAKAYDTPCDLEFTRDLDPSLPDPAALNSVGRVAAPSAPSAALPNLPRLGIQIIEPSAMPAWVFDEQVPLSRLRLGLCEDVGQADEWIALYRSGAAKVDSGSDSIFHSFRQDDFHYVMMIAVPRSERAAFVKAARAASIDFHDWLPKDQTDGPYLYELGLRPTWPDRKWTASNEWRGPSLPYVRFLTGYHWEYHLDGSLPEGFSLELPAPWLIRTLGLAADPWRPGLYRDENGEAVVVSSKTHRHSHCLIRKSRLQPLLDADELVPLWVGFGERSGWPKPGLNNGPSRRWNGIFWPISGGYRNSIWAEDHQG